MSEDFERVKRDITDFNTCIKGWNLDNLDDEEIDQIADLIQETMILLSQGDTAEYEED